MSPAGTEPSPGAVPTDVRDAIARHVRDATGLTFSASRLAQFDAALGRAVLATHARDAVEVLLRLQGGDAGVLEALAIELTIGETYILRDAAHFEFARELLAADAGGSGMIRLWSAGCATGEEAWSLAITAIEALGEAEAHARVEVLGTDLNPAFLRRAEDGCYGPWSFRRVATAVQERWFEPDGRSLRVKPALRRLVRFAPLNLVAPDDGPGAAAWPREVRVAFCRNVLIYFDPDSLVGVSSRLARSLAMDGWLVPGPSDPLLTRDDGFELIQREGMTVYHRAPPGRAVARGEAVGSAPRASTGRRLAAVPTSRVAPAAAPAPAPQPRDETNGAARARALADQGRHADALALLDGAIAAAPLDAGLYVLRAAVHEGAGDAAGAAADADRAVLLDRSLAAAHLASATARIARREPVPARRALRNAQRLLRSMPPDAVVPHAGGAKSAELRALCDQLARALDAPATARTSRRPR